MTTIILEKEIQKKVKGIGIDSIKILRNLLEDDSIDSIHSDSVFTERISAFINSSDNIWLKINGAYVNNSPDIIAKRNTELRRISHLIDKDLKTTASLITRTINAFRRAAYRGISIERIF